MSQMHAFPLAQLRAANNTSSTGQPLCPQCKKGYLHPHLVHIRLSEVMELAGWVAICVGNRDVNRRTVELYQEAERLLSEGALEPPQEACGFSMPMTAFQWDGKDWMRMGNQA